MAEKAEEKRQDSGSLELMTVSTRRLIFLKSPQLEIINPARRYWLRLFIDSLVLTGLISMDLGMVEGLARVALSLVHSRFTGPELVGLFFGSLVGIAWAFWNVYLPAEILWMLGGREVITVDANKQLLVVRLEVLHVCIWKSEYPLRQVDRLRVSTDISSTPGHLERHTFLSGQKTVLFDYDSKVCGVGRALLPSEAEKVIHFLKAKVPSLA